MNYEGFSIELKIQTSTLKNDKVMLDTRREQTVGYGSDAKYKGNGLLISVLGSGALQFLMDDGRTPLVWTSGPGTVKANEQNHIVINEDAHFYN